jgi:hypothetical protein
MPHHWGPLPQNTAAIRGGCKRKSFGFKRGANETIDRQVLGRRLDLTGRNRRDCGTCEFLKRPKLALRCGGAFGDFRCVLGLRAGKNPPLDFLQFVVRQRRRSVGRHRTIGNLLPQQALFRFSGNQNLSRFATTQDCGNIGQF